MNDIIQGIVLILGGKAVNGMKNNNTKALYEEYDYAMPFQLPRLNHPLFGNTFVYHKGEFKRSDAKVYGDIISKGLESLENIRYYVMEATTGSTVCKIKLRPQSNIRKAFNMQRQIKYVLNREDARVYNDGACVCVEIPNKVETVRFGDFMHDKRFMSESIKTVIPIGQDTNGKNMYADIAKMPHMLVAGTTGSGKSVFLNTIITSLLMKNTPDDMQLFLIDPKMVEFSKFQSLRYVHCVYEATEAVKLLSALCAEMDNRYAFLARNSCRDIDAFNKKHPSNKMPRLILIVDELADLMDTGSKKQVETNIVRIAQKARAAGIHMILSTQRPTVNVVSGRIKANIPCRVALSVTSKTDSMVILDRVGAESLLGNGDMLFLDGKNSKIAHRLQGGFIEDAEINNVVVPLVKENQPEDYEKINWDNVDLSENMKVRLK